MTFKTLSLALAATLFLANCGADGEPEQPDRSGSGVAVSGTVSVGITGSN